MTANILSHGTDLDTLFAPHVTSNATNLTGYRVSGVDIQSRYDTLSSPAQYNVSSRIPNVLLTTSLSGWAPNTDLSTIFCGNAGQYSLTTPAGGTKTTAGGWTSPKTWTHTLTISFANAPALTGYFFYGGRIQISPVHTLGTLADNDLSAMFSNMGTLVIYDVGTYRTGAGGLLISPNSGGSNIGTTPTTIYTTTDASPYSGTNYTVSIVANNSAGSATTLTITTKLYTITSGSVPDVYSGTYSSNIQQRNYPDETPPTIISTFV